MCRRYNFNFTYAEALSKNQKGVCPPSGAMAIETNVLDFQHAGTDLSAPAAWCLSLQVL